MHVQPFVTTLMTIFIFSLFIGLKQGREKKKKRENKNIMWVWERKLSKSYHKVVVQISFLFKQPLFYFGVMNAFYSFTSIQHFIFSFIF